MQEHAFSLDYTWKVIYHDTNEVVAQFNADGTENTIDFGKSLRSISWVPVDPTRTIVNVTVPFGCKPVIFRRTYQSPTGIYIRSYVIGWESKDESVESCFYHIQPSVVKLEVGPDGGIRLKKFLGALEKTSDKFFESKLDRWMGAVPVQAG